jgi:predicted RNase H-like nuclease
LSAGRGGQRPYLRFCAPKIKEVDAVLRADRTIIERVYEVHPELAFWRLNGERALDPPPR